MHLGKQLSKCHSHVGLCMHIGNCRLLLTHLHLAISCSRLSSWLFALGSEFHLQGYGFLSENATFVDICKDHGIEFIGPTSQHINIMGDKSTARDTMKVQDYMRCLAAYHRSIFRRLHYLHSLTLHA